jgi:hypothetical protein
VVSIVEELFCFASKHPDRGCVEGFDIEVVADLYDYEIYTVEAIVRALNEKEVIVAGRLADWAQSQGEKVGKLVGAGALRMRRLRAKQKHDPRQGALAFGQDAPPHEPAEGVTSGVTVRHACVTSATEREAEQRNQPTTQKTESVTARESALNDDGGSSGRDAPLGEPQPPENVVSMSDIAAERNAKRQAKLKANKKVWRQQKVWRFVEDTYTGEESSRRMEGMLGLDPDPKHDAQWWFDACDREMICTKWDDTRPVRRRA